MQAIINGFRKILLPCSQSIVKIFLLCCSYFIKVIKTATHLDVRKINQLSPVYITITNANQSLLTCKDFFMKRKFTHHIDNAKFFSIAFLILFANLLFSNNAIAQIAYREDQSATTSTTTLTITKPAGLAVGDIMIANILQSGNDGSSFVDAVGLSASWSLIGTDGTNLNNGNDRWRNTLLYKVATAADVAATDFTFTLDADSDDGVGGIVAFSGVAVTGGVSGGPFDVAPGNDLTGINNDNTLSATAISTATANAMVVMLGAITDDRSISNWSTTSPGTLTEAFDQILNVSLDMGVGAAYRLKTGTGSTGNGTATLSGNGNNGALLIALRACTANPTITTASTPQPAAAVCFSGSSQTTTLAYTATTNSPTAYSIDWNAAANTAGLTDQNSTAFAFAGGGGNVTGISIPASVAAGTYSGTMYLTTAAGCITSKTITLTINPSPTVNVGGALSNICQGGTSAPLGGSVGGAATGGTWDDGGAGGTFNPDANTLNATWTPLGSYTGTATLTLTTSGGSCGSVSAFKTQVVNATPPAASLGADDVICQVATTLAANTATPGTGAWTIPAGPNTSTAQITGGLNNPTATFTPTVAGAYTLRWTITSGGCAATFDEIEYTVNALPQVSAFNGNNICNGDIGTLTATLTGATPFTVTYTPGLAEGGVVSGSPFNVVPNPASPGTFNYTITSIEDNNGCIRTSGFTDAAATITVNNDGTWLGTADNDWFNGANWCGGNIPTAATDVVIASVTNQPTINASGAVCNNITINSGNTLTLTGSNTLTVSGNWVNNGTFTANAGTTVDFDGSTQTVTGATTFRNLTANSSTSLSLNSTTAVAGVLSVPATRTLIVNNITLTINAGATGSIDGTVRNTGGNGTVTATGTLTFNAGGTYDHNRNGGGIPTATWAATSNCNITGITNTVPTVSTFAPAGGFGNLTWNSTSQTSDLSLIGNLTDVNGNLTISNTGSGSVRLSNSGVTSSINISGNLSQSQGEFYIGGTGGTNTWTVNVDGNLSITGGTFFDLAGGGGATTINVKGNFTMSGGTLRESSNATCTINFTGNTTQLFSKTAGTISNTIAFSIANGATVDFGTSVLNGSGGTFTANSGSTLITANTAGISTSVNTGTIQVGGTKTYSATANYIFNGSSPQSTGNGLTGANNLTIDNSAGVTLTSNATVTGVLDFANGLLTTNANTITIASAGSITNADATKYVNGKLAKAFINTTPFTYPIGKGGIYSPVVFNYDAVTSKTATIEQFEAAFPVAIPSSVSIVNFGDRYWNITQSATGTAFTVGLNDNGITPAGTVRMIRSEGGGTATSNATSFSSPNHSNSSAFATANVSSNVALGETAIPVTINNVTVDPTKVYDGTTGAVLNTGSATLSGVISPDVVTLNSGSAVGNYDDKHVGTGKTVTVTGFTLGGANGGAYALPSPNQFAGLTADITIRPVTVSAVSDTKVYDGTAASAASPSYTLQPGDATGTAPTQTFDTKHAGTGKTLTASGLVINDGNSGNNYNISYAADITGEIQVRNITVTAVTDTKDYDGNTSSAGAPTYTLQPGDATGSAPTQTFDNATVGTGKTLTPSGLVISDGNSGNNYNIGYAANATGVINQLAVTVTPDAGQFKVFGDADPTFTYTATPSLVSPDVFSGSLSRVAGEAIGFYAYTLGSLTASSNYAVSLGGSNTFEVQAISQSNADFRSKANGNFSAAGTWEYDLGGGNWTNASLPPTSANNVSITHNVVLDQDYTVGSSKNFALGTGAAFTVNPTRTFAVALSGTADFDNKAVTFLSDNTGTASLGQVLGTLTGATNVTVERFIPNNSFRSWRLLSVPTFGNGQTIRQAWQEGDANPLPKQNNLPGYGAQITGVFTTQALAAAAGFDSTSVQAGMLTWGGTNWVNVNSTNTPIANNKAYFLYVRGDRSKSVTGATTDASATTLRTNGTVYTGDQVTNISANSFAVVPNLYPSAIDFTGLTRTGGVSNLFYVWDSKKLSGNSLGIYQTFSGTNGFNCLISGGSYVLGQPNTTIESGQGFFVQSNASAGTITLKETAKIGGTNGSLGFRPLTPASSIVKIDTRLYGAGANDMMDANAVVFDAAYSDAVDADDAPKFTNPGENIGIQKGNIVLAIEGRQPAAANDIIQFRTWNLQRQSYRLEVAAANMISQGVSAVLEDAYLQTSTALDLSGTTTINFTVDANAASSSVNRFRIVFRQLAPVPVNFVSITGHRSNGAVKVDWKSASERGIKDYVVERSADGRNFTAIGNTAPASNNAIEISYSFTDMAAPSTALMYRIKSQGVNNEIRYSPVAKVSALNTKTGFAISPNPVENGIVNLQFNALQAGKYSVRLVSTEGKTIQVRTVTHAGGSSVQNINLPATMATGTYTVEIIAPDNSKSIQTLFVNKN